MKYQVDFKPFVERYFIKDFSKKYKGAWDTTLKGLILEFTYVDKLFEKTIAETVCVSDDNNVRICKTEFKIAGTQVSRHASGNRCIIAVHGDVESVKVLLVYNKNHLGDGNETVKWKQLVKENYPEYRQVIA